MTASDVSAEVREVGPVHDGAPAGPGVFARWLRRIAVVGAVLVAAEVFIRWFAVPPYILPSPVRVVQAGYAQAGFLLTQTAVTAAEIGLGLLAGAGFGALTALLMALSPAILRTLRPVMVVSQALPVFAIAPLLVIWFGFGLASKIVMAGLIIYFPVAAAFLDGLRRTDPALVDFGRLHGASRLQMLRLIRVPWALPYLATGLKVAATVAPIGAVVGEWVGSSAGLGFVMLHANARMQTDLMFAALALLAVLALAVRGLVDVLLRRLVPWQADA
ncbi:MAG: ABC transporter permease [Rhodobiaceae bacterium]|nr:ABC transporter permease [Rhodobiaceae bacterium]